VAQTVRKPSSEAPKDANCDGVWFAESSAADEYATTHPRT